jgi:hypothetical protein
MAAKSKTSADKIAFVNSHTTIWDTNATAIGTTKALVTDLSDKALAASKAFTAQKEAQNAAKTATNTYNNAVKAMWTAQSYIHKQITTQAAIGGDAIYELADLPIPAKRSPKGAPGTPTELKVVMNPMGELELKWKCVNPKGTSGTLYMVYRRIGTGAFVSLGGTGEKRFVDTTIPVGTSQIVYKIQGIRSTAAGEWAQFIVTFGMNAGVTITQQDVRIAA